MTEGGRERAALGGPELRAALVESGVLRPALEDRLRPVQLPPGSTVVALDELGRRAAAARVALGRAGQWDEMEHAVQPNRRRRL